MEHKFGGLSHGLQCNKVLPILAKAILKQATAAAWILGLWLLETSGFFWRIARPNHDPHLSRAACLEAATMGAGCS